MSDVFGSPIAVVSAAPVQLFPGLTGRWFIRAENMDVNDSIFVGDSTVTASGGANPGAEISGGAADLRGKIESGVPVVNPENIYAICEPAATASVSSFAIRAAD